MTFNLHPRIDADSAFIIDLPLCQVRLIDNETYPWALLIPRQNDIKETINLSDDDQLQLMREISQVSKAIQSIYTPDKLNIGALGNMVPQLHVHVIARFKDDPAWPGAVWGQGGKQYSEDNKKTAINTLKEVINNA